MFLTRIDPKTNLVDISNTQDGVLAIKAFADVINDPNLGLACFTCIALSVDYASPMRKYSSIERPIASMRFVVGNSTAFSFDQDIIMEACDVYAKLQFNADLEEIRIIREMRLSKLVELKDAKDAVTQTSVLGDIAKIKLMQKTYSDVDENRLIDDSESLKNKYNLSRLEYKLKNKNTFYYGKRKQESAKRK